MLGARFYVAGFRCKLGLMQASRVREQPVAEESSALGGEAVASRLEGTPPSNPRLCPSCGSRYPADFRVCPRDASPLEDAPLDEDPLIGTTLGESYAIVRVIGEGGMGRVYEARHTRLHNKRYAVKMLHQDLARQPEVVTRFQREAEAASALSHPNIVGVYDVNATRDGRPYIVGELLEGVELGAYLDQVGKLPVESAVRVVRQVCQALAEAHRHGIVHRDMKPENIFLVGSEGHVKVLDFGISKLGEGNANLTKTGMVMGTPGYMAPEQARGARVDARADVYAVGAILYRCVTGKAPFEGLDPMATLTAVVSQEPVRPTQLEPDLPAALELVIQCAMAKNPDERFPNMEAFDAELAAFDPARASLLPPTPGVDAGADGAGGNAAPTIVRPAAASAAATRKQQTAPTMLAHRARDVRWARPGLVLLSAAAFLWLTVGLIVGLIAAIQLVRSDVQVTPTETVLSIIGSLAVMLTPSVLWIRRLVRLWSSTPRVLETAEQVKAALLGATVGYGVTMLAAVFLHAVLRDPAFQPSSPAWLIGLYVISLAVGLASWFSASRKRLA